MADYRSKRQKLEAMAAQTDSPHEAAVAREKLNKMAGSAKPPPNKKTSPNFFSKEMFEDAAERAAYSTNDEWLRRYREELDRLRRRPYYGSAAGRPGWWRQEPDLRQSILCVGGPWHGEYKKVDPGEPTVRAPKPLQRTGGGGTPLDFEIGGSGTYRRFKSTDAMEYLLWEG